MIICIAPNCSINCSDWIIFGLGVIVSIGWALFIYTLRPNLRIRIPEISRVNDRSIINIPIENLRRYSKASRILIEICALEGDITYHLIADSNDFAFIPKKNSDGENIRIFKAYKNNDFLTELYSEITFEDICENLLNQESKLRVRVHATHSFSGLGKTFEVVNDKLKTNS